MKGPVVSAERQAGCLVLIAGSLLVVVVAAALWGHP